MTNTRYFPPVHVHFSEHPFLSLANLPFTESQKTRGKGFKSNQEAVGILLFWFQEAVSKEKNGDWQNADFFFDKAYQYAKRFSLDAWQDLAQHFKIPSGQFLEEHVTTEVFIETHLGFYKSLKANESDKAQNRAIKHLHHVEYLATNFLKPDRQAEYLRIVHLLDIDNADSNLGHAIQVCQNCVQQNPKDVYFTNKLKSLWVKQTFGQVKEGQYKHNVTALTDGINNLEKLLQNNTTDFDLYAQIGSLYFVLAINQANDNHLSQALLSIQKAKTYDPNIDRDDVMHNKLIELMKDLQKHAKELQDHVSRNYNTHLTTQGQLTVSEAAIGFTTMNQYFKSPLYLQLIAQRAIAYYEDLLQRAKLTSISTDRIATAKDLDAALNHVTFSADVTENQIAEEWQQVALDYPHIAQLVSPKTAFGIVQSYYDKAYTAKDQMWHSPIFEAVPELKPVVSEEKKGTLSLRYWLWSGQDKPVKWLAAAAILFAITIVGMTGMETWKNHQRNKAYTDLTSLMAQETIDFPILRNHIQVFLKNKSFLSSDLREGTVKAIYAKYFTQWFVNETNINEMQLKEETEKYRALVGDLTPNTQ